MCGSPAIPSRPPQKPEAKRNPRVGWIIVVLVPALAGCGGGESRTPADVEQMVYDNARARIEQQGLNATLDRPDCVEDGDSSHYRCVATMRISKTQSLSDAGSPVRVTMRVTCDKEKCLTEPDQAFPGSG